MGYGPQRNKAIQLCQSEWILNIDADEEISPKLCDKIQILQEPLEYRVYKVSFTGVCFGKKSITEVGAGQK